MLQSNPNNDLSVMKDISEGSFMNTSSILENHPDALLIGLYTDEFEVVNAIGVHRKIHKIMAFYWTLLNIPVMHRSKLASIQLLCLGKSVDIKMRNGSRKMLEDFVSSMQQLANGVEITVAGNKRTFYGKLLCAFGDTPAAQSIGGFKEGVGAATSPCRTCNTLKENMDKVLHHDACPIRSYEEHTQRLEQLNLMNSHDRAHWSQQWGINTKTFIHDVPEFDVTKCILHDPMHILLEGICKTELQNLLHHLIYCQKLFSLDELNRRLMFFEYADRDMRDKPQKIEKKHLSTESTFPQTAASMLILMHSFPFILFDYVSMDNDHWLNLLRLLQIVFLCTPSMVSEKTAVELQCLISLYLHTVSKLYPNRSFSPKMHYLIHFPQQLKLFGPLRTHWCMRFEGKHAFFKQKRLFNFKNLPLTLAQLHQRWICSKTMSGSVLEDKTYSTPQPMQNVIIEDIAENHEVLNYLNALHAIGASSSDHIMLCSSIRVNNLDYEPGTVLNNGFCRNTGLPFLLVIKKNIYVFDSLQLFFCNDMSVVSFESKLNAFHVESSATHTIVSFAELFCKWPQLVHTCERKKYVMLHHVDKAWSV